MQKNASVHPTKLYLAIYRDGIAHQQNNRGAGDLIKLSVFRQHVIEMQLLERQYTTNVHAHLCARRNMFSTAAREKISLKHAASFEQNNY